MSIPKKIWILWFQGESDAPELVRECIKSWRAMNLAWEVVVLDSGNVNQYVDIDFTKKKLSHLSLAFRSDLIRLQLLKEYGGIWVDATVYCAAPLDEWVGSIVKSGFFAFSSPGEDRVLSNWFLLAEKENVLICKLLDKLMSFWLGNVFPTPLYFRMKLVKKFTKILKRNKNRTRFWLSPVMTKILRIYPYFIFHYMFYDLICRDQDAEAVWSKTEKIYADDAHALQNFGLYTPLSDKAKYHIDCIKSPLYKLTWKSSFPQLNSHGTVLEYLFKSRQI